MSLTNEQLDICNEKDWFVVRACPGSGKTFTIAHKVAKLISQWDKRFKGIAVLSFTNNAVEEIKIKLKELNVNISHPHFIGTIDIFINSFIFMNHGHLELNCKIKPILVGETGIPWNARMYSKDQFFDRISCDKDGNILKLLPLQELFSDLTDSALKSSKKKFWRQGFVTQSDINYFSMKLLQNEKYNILIKIIKNRFEYVIIDEAQDVNDIQMEIIDILIENDIKIILIGDPDQSIFEFNHAKPELFQNKAEKAKENNLLYGLNTNFRSSQEICDFSYNFSELPSKSISHTGNSGIPPKIVYYENANEFGEILNKFLKDCEKFNIESNNENVAVVARSNKLLNKIAISGEISEDLAKIWGIYSGTPYKRNFAKDLAYAKHLYDNQEISESFRLMQKIYISIKKETNINCSIDNIINKKGYFNFKSELKGLITLMPPTNKNIGEWIDEFHEKVKKNENYIFNDLFLKIKRNYRELPIKKIFATEKNEIKKEYHLSNIHQAKGKTFDAVLIILSEKGSKWSYKTLINQKIEENIIHEELRNIYVGITRPRKILHFVVHKNQKTEWGRFLTGERQMKLL